MSKSSDKNKLILVVVIFVLAALVLAWNMGWLPFGGGSTSPQGPAANVPADPNNPGAPAPEETPGNRRAAPPQ